MPSIITSIFRATSFSGIVSSLFTESAKTKIGELVIDACIVENLQMSNTITEHPVENKTTITDHIFNKPLKLRVEGVITDTPLKIFGLIETPLQKNSIQSLMNNAKSFLPFGKSIKPSQQAYQILKQMYSNRSLCTVISKFERFENMAVEDLSFTSDSETGASLRFTITLQQVRFANVQSVKNIKSAMQGKISKKVNVGYQEKVEETNASGLERIYDKAKEVFNGFSSERTKRIFNNILPF